MTAAVPPTTIGRPAHRGDADPRRGPRPQGGRSSPAGQALGVTFSAPDADRFNFDQRHLLGLIKVALGGLHGRGDRVRGPDHRRGVRHPAAHADRPPHGWSWGMSPAIGPIAVLPIERYEPAATGRIGDVRVHAGGWSTRRVRRIVENRSQARSANCLRSHLPEPRSRWPPPCSSARLWTRLTHYAAAGLPRDRPALMPAPTGVS